MAQVEGFEEAKAAGPVHQRQSVGAGGRLAGRGIGTTGSVVSDVERAQLAHPAVAIGVLEACVVGDARESVALKCTQGAWRDRRRSIL
eukprot:350185-Chlamydomonas_euryale.AAC.2